MYPPVASAVGQVITLVQRGDRDTRNWLHTPPDCLVETRSFGERDIYCYMWNMIWEPDMITPFT